jgi:hypothetical protein
VLLANDKRKALEGIGNFLLVPQSHGRFMQIGNLASVDHVGFLA